MTVNPRNLTFLYQGMDRHSQETEYSQLPYRLALIRANSALGIDGKVRDTNNRKIDTP